MYYKVDWMYLSMLILPKGNVSLGVDRLEEYT